MAEPKIELRSLDAQSTDRGQEFNGELMVLSLPKRHPTALRTEPAMTVVNQLMFSSGWLCRSVCDERHKPERS